MNGEFKRYIYILGGLCIAFVVISIFLHVLPYLLVAGVVGYAITKVVQFIKSKSKKKLSNNFEDSKVEKYDYNTSSNDYTNGEIIDVEYEEVDNKEK